LPFGPWQATQAAALVFPAASFWAEAPVASNAAAAVAIVTTRRNPLRIQQLQPT
jgi:hypothetical protein